MATETKEAPVKVKRPLYVDVAPAAEKDEKGLLRQVPEAYNSAEHRAPRRADFADEAIYFDFQAARCEVEASALADKAKTIHAKAEQIRQFGDPAQRKQMQKFNKYMENITKLRDELAESGHQIDLQALLQGLGK